MEINLQNLDFENIGAWPDKMKLAVIACCCAMIMVLAYVFIFKSQLTDLEIQRQNEQDLKHQIQVKETLAINFSAYNQQLLQMQKTFQVMLQQLPGQTEVPGLLEDISKIGVSSGLEFKLFKPLPEKQLDFYAELPIQIIVVGNYHQLAQFVSRVSSLDRIVSLNDFSIDSASAVNTTNTPNSDPSIQTTTGDKLVMEITAKTYRYTEGRLSK